MSASAMLTDKIRIEVDDRSSDLLQSYLKSAKEIMNVLRQVDRMAREQHHLSSEKSPLLTGDSASDIYMGLYALEVVLREQLFHSDHEYFYFSNDVISVIMF